MFMGLAIAQMMCIQSASRCTGFLREAERVKPCMDSHLKDKRYLT